MTQIYVVKNHQQCGPFPPEEISRRVDSGEFSWDDLAWYDGMEGWEPLETVCERLGPPPIPEARPAPAAEPQFHHVSPGKFVFMSLVTLGLYELYWFYRGWKFVKRQEDSSIWPFWRAFFSPIWFYPFAQRVFAAQGQSHPGWAGLLTAGYILVALTWRLPDPYWLLTFLSIVFVLPLVVGVNRVNRAQGTKGVSYRRFGILHVLTTLVGLPLFAFTVASSLHLIPSTQVVEGKWVPGYHEKFLNKAGILPEGEPIVYFYSSAFMNYRADGNFFTPLRVVSYWEENGEIYMEEALMSNLEDLSVEYSTTILNESTITVSRADGTSFILLVSGEGERDRLFLDSLKQHWREARAAVGEP